MTLPVSLDASCPNNFNVHNVEKLSFVAFVYAELKSAAVAAHLSTLVAGVGGAKSAQRNVDTSRCGGLPAALKTQLCFVDVKRYLLMQVAFFLVLAH